MGTVVMRPGEPGWLDDFIARVPGATHCIAVSSDGLRLASSAALPEDRADQLAAVTSGLASLTEGAARCFNAGAVTETVVEMEAGTMMLMTMARGAVLAVLAEAGGDIGAVAYEMALLVQRYDEHTAQDAVPAEMSGLASSVQT